MHTGDGRRREKKFDGFKNLEREIFDPIYSAVRAVTRVRPHDKEQFQVEYVPFD